MKRNKSFGWVIGAVITVLFGAGFLTQADVADIKAGLPGASQERLDPPAPKTPPTRSPKPAPEPNPAPRPDPKPAPDPAPDSAPLPGAVRIEATQTDCIAPCGVHFTATIPGETRQTLIAGYDVTWDFGDEGSTFRALGDDFPYSRNANKLIGPFGGHVFAAPGEYTVTVTAEKLDDDFRGAGKITITVQDPDQAFSGDKTIVVSGKGHFVGAPAGAQRFSTLNDGMTALNRLDAGRLLLRAGEVFTLSRRAEVRNGSGFAIDRFGEGRDPIIDMPGKGDGLRLFSVANISVANIAFNGDYDPSTGLGDSALRNPVRTLGGVDNLTLYRLSIAGFGNGFSELEVDGLVVADCDIRDWYDYGLLLDGKKGDRFAIVGNSIKQSIDAVSGPGAKSRKVPRWADHGPIRSARTTHTVVSQNDLRSLNGWSSEGKAHQPNIRYNASGEDDHAGSIVNNRMTGGWIALALSPANGRIKAPAGAVLVKDNFIKGTDNTKYAISSQFGGVRMENNLFIMPDVETSFQHFEDFVRLSRSPASTPANDVTPVTIKDNVFASFQGGSRKSVSPVYISDDWRATLSLTDEGNVFIAPNAVNADDFDAMIDADLAAAVAEKTGLDWAVVLGE